MRNQDTNEFKSPGRLVSVFKRWLIVLPVAALSIAGLFFGFSLVTSVHEPPRAPVQYENVIDFVSMEEAAERSGITTADCESAYDEIRLAIENSRSCVSDDECTHMLGFGFKSSCDIPVNKIRADSLRAQIEAGLEKARYSCQYKYSHRCIGPLVHSFGLTAGSSCENNKCTIFKSQVRWREWQWKQWQRLSSDQTTVLDSSRCLDSLSKWRGVEQFLY